jgi:hypothetical protein
MHQKRTVVECEIEFIHFACGFQKECPKGFETFLELRADLNVMKSVIDPKKLSVVKSKAKKADWIQAFINLPMLEKRNTVIRNKAIISLLPRDLKTLKLDSVTPCGTKSFNPGKQIEFDVYGIWDVLAALISRQDG